MRHPRFGASLTIGAALLLVACGQGAEPTPARLGETVVTGLVGPTQLVVTDGEWFVAELNGDEDARQGRVLRIDPETRATSVVLDGLDKPTGIAVLDGEIWVMQRRSLGRAAIDPTTGAAGPLQVVLDDLPYNGRSESTLTVTDHGTLVYATTGAERGGEVVDGSGTLWELDPADAAAAAPFATGLKNAYAHVVVDANTIVTTEIGDGTYDGVAPYDEVVRLQRGDDAGWPRCDAQGRPVRDRGGSVTHCDATVAPLTTFPQGATPTGIAMLRDGRHVVALWALGEVVVVDADGVPTTWLTELSRPQHVVVDGDRILVTDHGSGSIVAVEVATAPG